MHRKSEKSEKSFLYRSRLRIDLGEFFIYSSLLLFIIGILMSFYIIYQYSDYYFYGNRWDAVDRALSVFFPITIMSVIFFIAGLFVKKRNKLTVKRLEHQLAEMYFIKMWDDFEKKCISVLPNNNKINEFSISEIINSIADNGTISEADSFIIFQLLHIRNMIVHSNFSLPISTLDKYSKLLVELSEKLFKA